MTLCKFLPLLVAITNMYIQGRINHWANWASRLNIKTLLHSCFMFLGCSPRVKIVEILVTLFSIYCRLRKLTTLAFIVFEWRKRIEPNSTTLYDPRVRSKSVQPRASAEIFLGVETSTFCLSISGCWRCNANARSQNALPFLPLYSILVEPQFSTFCRKCFLHFGYPVCLFFS